MNTSEAGLSNTGGDMKYLPVQARRISSTKARMFHHMDRLLEIKQRKIIRPITIHLAPTNRCNLTCEFCSTMKRGTEELSFQDTKEIVDIYAKLGIKSVEITGGGDPTMYPHLAELIEYTSAKGLDVGLITNGLLLNTFHGSTLKKLTWMRISLAGIDFDLDDTYRDLNYGIFPAFYGCSFVFTRETPIDRMKRAYEIAHHLKARYLRIVPNCYDPAEIEWARNVLPDHIQKVKSDSAHEMDMFLQIKDHRVPISCHWKYLKPFVNADGYVYQCSTCSLFAEHFPRAWRVSHWKDVAKIYEEPIVSFDNSQCTHCFYKEQNEIIHDVLIDVNHPTFL